MPLELHEVGPSKNEEYEEVHLQEPHFLEGPLKMNEKKIQREMGNIKGNFMSLLFDRKNVIELIEWLHESYLKNNEVIYKLTIQNEHLLKNLQDTCFPSDVSDFHKVDCL